MKDEALKLALEPVAWLYPEGLEALKAGKCWTAYGTKQDDNCNISVYLAAVAPKVEPVKTECDGFDSHPAAPVQEPVAWVDSVMEQAQVFASAWSLVGSRFDSGSGLEDAEQAKAELRAMLTAPPAAQHTEPVGCVADIDRLQRQMFLDLGYSLSDPLYATPPAQPPVQEPVAWIDSVMEQAQVFASAWSLVGSRFDSGNEMENAEEQKKALRAMLSTPPAAQPEKKPQNCGTGYCSCIECVMKPEQEPIGYFTVNDYDNWEQIDGTSGKPLYEFPEAQRQWVGLTKDERSTIESEVLMLGEGYPEVFAAIEAKLKEKNT